jgi:hypothetical protein
MSRAKNWNLELVGITANKYLLKGANPAANVAFF